MKQKSSRHYNVSTKILIFALSLFLFTYGVQAQEVIGFDSRFFLFMREMWLRGLSFFPTTYFSPYPDYPAAAIWLMYFSGFIFGGINKLSAIFPSAVAAALTVVMTYQIGALQNKLYGFCAILFLFLTYTFLKSARTISLDMYPTLIAASCFYLIYSADLLQKPSRIKWIVPLLVIAFCFRGPIGLVIPTGVVCTYYLLHGQWKKFFQIGLTAFILLLICTAGLLALAYHVGGNTFMQDVLRMQVAGRIDNYYRPFYFYFTDSLINYAIAFPIAVIMMAMIMISKKKLLEWKFLLSCMGWILVILIGMSIPGDKKVRYILPIAPALSLLAAYPFFAADNQKFLVIFSRILQKFFLFFPAIFLLLTVAAYYYLPQKLPNFSLNYAALSAIFLSLQAINLWDFYAKRTHFLRQIFCAAVSFYVATIAIFEPIELHIERGKKFVMYVENLRNQAHTQLVFYKENPDGLPIKYRMNMPILVRPVFIDNESSLKNYTGRAFIVAGQASFDALSPETRARFHVIMSGRLGHVPVVVFTQNITDKARWYQLWQK